VRLISSIKLNIYSFNCSQLKFKKNTKEENMDKVQILWADDEIDLLKQPIVVYKYL
jgi:hypothetical protein